jgi:FolB domain-containing protein
MPDRIFVDNLRLNCVIGITPEERSRAQEVLIDTSLFLDLSRAGNYDDIEQSVNYKTVMQRIIKFASGKEFALLESLAEGTAAAILESFPVERVVVKVRKAKYSFEPSIGVEVSRDRKTWSSR